MWLFVFFDLPTETKKDKINYSRFRGFLQNDGFTMMQYSVYIRHCASSENAQVHIKRTESHIPPRGQVSILQITDKQYSNILNFWNVKPEKVSDNPVQLELF